MDDGAGLGAGAPKASTLIIMGETSCFSMIEHETPPEPGESGPQKSAEWDRAGPKATNYDQLVEILY